MDIIKTHHIRWILVLIVLISFCLFYALKLNGYMDFTSKFGVESMSCIDRNDNSLFIIDDDQNTTWGLDEEHEHGELFLIRFRAERTFSSMTIVNTRWQECATKRMNIYVSKDEAEWQQCEVLVNQVDAEHTVYTFCEDYIGKYVRLEYAEEPGFWPITELLID